MEKSGSPIDKPFDRVVKDLAEEAPRLLLDLVGLAPVDSDVTVLPLLRETAPPVTLPDYVAELVLPSGERSIGHVEFLAWYRSSYSATMARYGGSLAWQYRIRVESILLLLRPGGVPKDVPEFGEVVIENTRTTHPFRTVRLWELDPAPVLESGNPRLFPWAVLMRSTDELVRGIAAAIVRQGDELTTARFLTLGSIRYDREHLEEMAGGKHMGLVEAIMEGSSLVREATEIAAAQGRQEGLEEGRKTGLEKGLEQGLEQGIGKGRIDEARRLLRRALRTRFPGLVDLAVIDSIENVDVLEEILFDEVLAGGSRERIMEVLNTAGSV